MRIPVRRVPRCQLCDLIMMTTANGTPTCTHCDQPCHRGHACRTCTTIHAGMARASGQLFLRPGEP